MLVKDEADILPHSLRHLATQVTHVYLIDNMSTDSTPMIAANLAKELGNISIHQDTEVAYTQSAKLSHWAEVARKDGARFVLSCDADEIWRAPNNAPLTAYLDLLDRNSGGDVFEATLHDHVVTSCDDQTGNFIQDTHWRRRDPLPLPKVICRALPGLVIGMGNHDARYPGRHIQRGTEITVCHFPYRSVDQFVRKVVNGAKAYEAAGSRVPTSAGGHWRAYYDAYQRGGREAIEEIYNMWFHTDDPLNDPRNAYEICHKND